MAHSGNPPRIVIFGGIGSGKSTATALFAKRGAVVIEADRIGHAVLMPDGPAYTGVAERWPTVVVDGEIDRRALAAIVFADESELRALEALTHPWIVTDIVRQAAAAGAAPVVLEMPLIRDFVDDGWSWVLVDAPAELRLERAVARGAAETDVLARMAAQPEDVEWHARADWILPNAGSFEDLEDAVDELWSELAPSA